MKGKTLILLTAVCALLLPCQIMIDGQQNQQPQFQVVLKSVESITWTPGPNGGELSWVVAERKPGPDGDLVKTGLASYKILPRDCVMSSNGERRGFDLREGEEVRMLLNLLHMYAIQSSVWWQAGRGYPVGEDGKPILPQAPPVQKPDRPPINKQTPATVRASIF